MPESKFQELKLEKERFKRKPLRIEVYEFLRQSITRGALKPGQKLNEIDLGAHLGISRTPIREALMRLEQEGLVHLDPGRGAVVAEISKVDLGEIYPIVATLEGLAARLATPRLGPADIDGLEQLHRAMKQAARRGDAAEYMSVNARFHQVYLDRCGNQRLSTLLQSYKDQIYRFRIFSLNIPDRMHASVAEHASIIEAFDSRDAELAGRRVQEHVEQGGRTLERLTGDPDPA
jgi:DNA-binding GntR family transcriptional regulator